LKFEHYGIGILKGLSVTILHLFRRPAVAQFPEYFLNVSRRSRGNELIWNREKCTGCATCAKSCPQGVIEIVTSTNLADNKYEVETYRVDTGSYERARYRRGDLVQTNDELLESPERPASGYYHPEVAEKLPRQTLLIEKVAEKRKK
jgi:NAD(P)H-quinone oxidoreductase subunit I